jgi:hypothetical protein
MQLRLNLFGSQLYNQNVLLQDLTLDPLGCKSKSYTLSAALPEQPSAGEDQQDDDPFERRWAEARECHPSDSNTYDIIYKTSTHSSHTRKDLLFTPGSILPTSDSMRQSLLRRGESPICRMRRFWRGC